MTPELLWLAPLALLLAYVCRLGTPHEAAPDAVCDDCGLISDIEDAGGYCPRCRASIRDGKPLGFQE